MTKAERLLYLINLIRSHHNLASKVLAQKCGVSARTIFRDVNSLASAGLPIYYDHGYRFLEGAFLPTLNLTDEELTTLEFAVEFSPLKTQPSLFNLAKGAYAKLRTNGGKLLSERPERTNSTGEVKTTSSSEMRQFSVIFKLLNQAIAQKKTIEIKYKKRGNQLGETLIEPYALVYKNPNWFVFCYCQNCEKIATYDVSKIKSISLTTQPFKSKINLDKFLAAPK